MMEAVKPRTNENDFSKVGISKSGQLIIHNDRFKTRVRGSKKVSVPTTLEYSTCVLKSNPCRQK